MNIFLQDPNEIRLSPEQVRLRDIKISPEPRLGRIKIILELTPFMKKPNIEVTIRSASGKESARASILETMLPKLELTMHLRQPEPGSEYTAETTIYYQTMPSPSEIPVDLQLPDPLIVDQQVRTFILPKLEP